MTTARKPTRKRVSAHEEEHEANHERWLLTYADMITLLMVLFIVLFAVSVVDKKKFAELADGLSRNLGNSVKVLPAGTGVLDGGKTDNDDQGQLDNNPDEPITPVNQADIAAGQSAEAVQAAQTAAAQQEQTTLTKAEQRIAAALKAQGLQDSVKLTIDSRGLVVSIVTDQVLFDTGQATLKPIGDQVLDVIGPVLATLPNDISVEGHTDNVPITGGPFPSNWELSAVRATTVLRYLVANDGLPADRMSATGYAETRPVVPNDTAAHRSQNRRVDIVVLTTLSVADASAASAAPAVSGGASTDPSPLPTATGPDQSPLPALTLIDPDLAGSDVNTPAPAEPSPNPVPSPDAAAQAGEVSP